MIVPIWEPRYHDDCMLIDKDKVRDYTQIRFTKTNKFPGIFWIPGDVVRKYPLQPNGGTEVHQVPMFELNQWPDEQLLVEGME